MELKWDVGSHIGWEKNLTRTFASAVNSGMYSFQFFMGSPKSFTRAHITDEDLASSVALNTRFPSNVFSHAPYLYNLCGSKGTLAWEGDAQQDVKTRKMLSSLTYELGILSNFTEKKNGVVVHPGNYADRKVGLKKIAQTINLIDFPANSKLLLENSAGQGTSLATTIEEIRLILSNVNSSKSDNVGICLDTAHIFGYGEYDIRRDDEICRMFSTLDSLVGRDKLVLVHLNDSEVDFGTKKDRHELIGDGKIWEDDQTSLLYLLNECERTSVPLVLETTPDDINKFLK